MTDNLGFELEKRRQGNLDVLAGRASFRYCNADRGSLRVLLK